MQKSPSMPSKRSGHKDTYTLSKPTICPQETTGRTPDSLGEQKEPSRRKVCGNCHYPLQTCVCSALTHIENKTNVIILQDKNEVNNAKNTARLLALSLSNISIVRSDDIESMRKLETACIENPTDFALFYPSNSSSAFGIHVSSNSETPLNEIQEKTSETICSIKHVLFIDGTWRKAKRLYLSNDWLQRLPNYHFDESIPGQYRIRKTSVKNGLSTLEAVAYVLSKTDDANVQGLHDLFEKMQSHWPES
jgi:DTW domain-containing protein YfiP